MHIARWRGSLALLCATCLSGCLSPSSAPEPGAEVHSTQYQKINAFVQAMNILHGKYVDPAQVEYEQLWHQAMSGMAGQLDPYSDYEPPQEFRRQQIKRTGEFVGVGIDIFKSPGKMPMVSRVMPQSPAHQGGVRPGDAIKAIDGKPTARLNIARCARLLQGNTGTKVQIEIVRRQESKTLTLVRGKVIRPSIRPEAVKVLAAPGGAVGYIRIEHFSLHTPREFQQAFLKLRHQQVKALILDLRHNLGGVVNAAVQVASMLLPENTVIFAVRNRQHRQLTPVKTVQVPLRELKFPVVVLTNPLTASAAEILVGALQDHRRAQVVGMRTFGKGTILNVVKLVDGGALRYASAYYVTPRGRTIEKRGIRPDVEIKLPASTLYKLDAQAWRHPGEIQCQNGIKDITLERALAVVSSKLVAGGK